MKLQLTPAVAVLVSLACGAPADAAPIFVDEFTANPETTGWSVGHDGAATVTSDGTQLVFSRAANSTSGNGFEVDVHRTISTYGFSGITAAIAGSQTGAFDPPDYIRLQYNLANGTGWHDLAPFPLSDDISGAAFSYPSLALPAGASNNPYFQVRIATDFNAAAEVYRVANFGLNGTAVAVPPNPVVQFFADNGSVDPAANGWTEVTASMNQNISSDGSAILFTRTVNQPQEDLSIIRSFDTTGYTDIALAFRVTGSGVLETADSFTVRYDLDDGNGIQTLFSAPNPNGTISFLDRLPAGAAENPNLTLEFLANFNGALEVLALDDISLFGISTAPAGATVPEPTSIAIWTLASVGVGAFYLRRRRQQSR